MSVSLRGVVTGILWGALGYFYLYAAQNIGFTILDGLLDNRDGWLAIPKAGIPIYDFGAFWLAGHLAAKNDIQNIYRPEFFNAIFSRIFDTGPSGIGWYYPPQSLPLASLFGVLPPKIAFCVWTFALPLGAYILLRRLGYEAWIILSTLLSPAALVCAFTGQRGVLLAILALAGAAGALRAHGRPGLFLGLTIIKPGAMLLVPVALLALRAWKALLWAVLGGVALTALALALYGTGAFELYWRHTLPAIQSTLANDARFSAWRNATTVYWSLQSFGLSVGASLVWQAVATCMAATFVAAIGLSRRFDPRMAVAVALILSPMASSDGFNYDMVGYEAGIALAIRAAGRDISVADGFFWLAPLLMVTLTTASGYDYSLMPMAIVAAALHAVALPLWRQGRVVQ